MGGVDAAEFGEGGEPVAAVGDLSSHFVFGDVTGPGDDGRHADTAFEEAEFCAAIGPGTSASAVGAFFGAVAMVGLKYDDGVVGLAEFIDFSEE